MTERTYLRDGRAPVPKDARVSETMSRIRGRDTGPERAMRALLSSAGVRGYRLNHRGTPGRPDVTFVGRKVAVFVHGCYWHGCPHCTPSMPRTHSAWWRRKIGANQMRDARKTTVLRKLGWSVTVVWECRLRESPRAQLTRVLRALGRLPIVSRSVAGRSAARNPRRTGTARRPLHTRAG